MTTKIAASLYSAQHEMALGEQRNAVFNPQSRPLGELPTIFGLNNGGSSSWWHGALLAEDGTRLGEHICSDEGYMPHDLGVLDGSRPDRHEQFRAHYPDGYRMEFVPYGEIAGHVALRRAIGLARDRQAAITKGRDDERGDD